MFSNTWIEAFLRRQHHKNCDGNSQQDIGESRIDCVELEPRVLYSASPINVEMVEDIQPDVSPELIFEEAVQPFSIGESAELTGVTDLPFPTQSTGLEGSELVLDGVTTDFAEQSLDPDDPSTLLEEATRGADDPVSIVLVDQGVQGHEALVADIKTNQPQSVIEYLRSDRDGIDQISDLLSKHRFIESVHIVSHGSNGQVQLGNSVLNHDSLSGYAAQIASWSSSLSTDADILFYGCNLAANAGGQELIESIGILTGADIAASDDYTGHRSLGGDWLLEYQFGELNTEIVFGQTLQDSWHFRLDIAVFQQGVDGYSGTVDTEIDASNPDADNSTSDLLETDDIPQKQVLIRFEDLFGTGANQIDAGSIINSATLTIQVSNASGGKIDIHEMLIDWDETDTWNSLNNGVSLDDLDASSILMDRLVDADLTGARTFTLSSTAVQRWADGEANYGFVIVNDNDDVWRMRSSEGTIAPILTVDYTTPTLNDTVLVNLETAEQQITADSGGNSVARSDNGNSIVVWSSDKQDGDGFGVYAQVYDASGARISSEIEVNTHTIKSQQNPSVAVDDAGNFVVVWESADQDSDGFGVYGQRFDAAGEKLGGEFLVNTHVAKEQINPAVAMDADGDFVVVWQSFDQDGDGFGIFARRFDSIGDPVGGEFVVNTLTSFDQFDPSVAMSANGEFVVTWTADSVPNGDGFEVIGQRFDANGNAAGLEFQVNTYFLSDQFDSSVAMNDSGQYTVVWTSDAQDGSNSGIYGRSYDANGSALTGELLIPEASMTLQNQSSASVSMQSNGDFTVTWTHEVTDTIYYREFNRDGIAFGGQIQVDATTDLQQFSGIAVDDNGGFTIAWTGDDPVGDDKGVFASFYGDDNNQKPVITPGLNTLNYTESDPATIIDSTITVSDVDSTNFAGGYFQVDFATGGTINDRLEINHEGFGAGQIGLAGSIVRYGNVDIGTFSGGNDGLTPLVVLLNSAATPQATEALARNITYQNVADAPATDARRLRFFVNDGDGHASLVAYKDINVTIINDAPVISTPGDQNITEGGIVEFEAGINEIVIDDPDIGTEELKVTLTITDGLIKLGATNDLTFITGDGNDNQVMVFTGTQVAVNNALDGLRLTPPGWFVGTTQMTIEVSDQGASGAGGEQIDIETIDINVTSDGVNDSPKIVIPGNQNTIEDQPLFFSATSANRIQLEDDAGGNDIEVTLGINDGTLTLGTTAGLSFTAGSNGTAAMTVRGTVAEINAALDGMYYSPSLGFVSTATLNIAVDDLGNSGGAAQTDSASLDIDVDIRNRAPDIVAPTAVTTVENTDFTFDGPNLITFSDVDAAGQDLEVTISVTHGVLTLGDPGKVDYTVGDGINDSWLTFRGRLSDLNQAIDSMVFSPETGYAGSSTLQISINDLGNTGAGGALTDSELIVVFEITPDGTDDSPINTVPGTQSTNEETPLVFSDANGNIISISDDTGAGTVTVTLTANDGTISLSNTKGGEFIVNTNTADHQEDPRVAMAPDGSYLVVWASHNQDGSGDGVYGRRYDDSGAPLGGEFRINEHLPGDQNEPSIAVDDVGNFVVVWTSNGQDGSSTGVYGRLYNADATPASGEFLVNNTTSNEQRNASVAMDANGDFVVVWQSKAQDSADNWGVFGMRFDASGSKLDAFGAPTGVKEFLINTETSDDQTAPVVAMDDAGNFAVAWQSKNQDGDDYGVFAKRFDAAGQALDDPTNPGNTEFQVNTVFFRDQSSPSIAMDDDGDFVIAWQSEKQDHPSGVEGLGVFAQRFDSGGNIQGVNFLVNETIINSQSAPTVAIDGDGNFVVAWQAEKQDNPDGKVGVYGQRFDHTGAELGGEFLINSTTIKEQGSPAIAMGDNGSFVSTWQSKGQDSADSWGVYGQLYKDIRALTFHAGDGFNDAVITIEGTVDQINDALNGLVFTPDTDFVGTASLDIVTDDGNTTPDSDTVLIDVAAVNDAPTVSAPTNVSIVEGQSLIFSSGNGNQISVTDVDVTGPEIVEVTILATQGTISLNGSLTGLSFSDGDGVDDASMTFTGTVTDINTALDGMSFTAPETYAGSALLQINIDDQGNVGIGQDLSGSGTVDIDVTSNATNDVPEILVPGPQRTPKNQSLVFEDDNGTLVSILDDSGNNNIEVMIEVTNGIVSLSPSIATEFRVNTETTGNQLHAVVAAAPNGDYVVVWQSELQDGNGSGIYGQRYNSAGQPAGTEFLINEVTLGDQEFPVVAINATGQFAIAWQSANQDGSGDGIYTRVYGADGTPLGGEVLVNSITEGNQTDPSIAMDDSGNFVIVWEGPDGGGPGTGVYGQLFDASGIANGSEFLVNTVTAGDQGNPQVAMDADGDFIVVWQGKDTNGDGILAQRYDSNGDRVGSEFLVATVMLGNQTVPDVAMDDAGNFVVVWQSPDEDGLAESIVGRRFDNNGVPQGANFVINTSITGNQESPSIDMNGSGEFFVAWESADADAIGSYGQRFDASANKVGEELLLNTSTTGLQDAPAVAMDANGAVITVWTASNDQDGDGDGIFGQRISDLGNLTFTAGDGENDNYIVLTGSLQDINDALANMKFTPNAGFVGLATVKIDVDDLGNSGSGGSLSSSETLDIFVGSGTIVDLDGDNSNGSGSSYNTNFFVGGGPVAITDTDVVIDDPANNDLDSMTVTITNWTDGANELLASDVTGTGISISSFVGGVLTLTGTDSLANYELVLSRMTYDNVAGSPTYATRVIEVVGFVGIEASNTAQSNVTFASAPTDIAPDSFVVDDNTDTSGGYSLGKLVTVDPNPGDSFTYSIEPGADGAVFSIGGTNSDELVIDAGIIDYGTKSTYSVNLRVTDATGLTYDETLTVEVNNPNQAPVITSDGGGATAVINVAEGQTTVTDVDATDADLPADTLTYSISGGADQALFNINASTGVLTFGTGRDFETSTDADTDGVYEVQVAVSDGIESDVQDISVTITDVNEAPTVSLTNLVNNLTEDTDTSSAIRIADIVITDDALGTNNLTLSGADAGDFEIVGNELRLKAGTTLDFETKTSFDVTVEVDDTGVGGTPDDTAAHTLSITDVNEAPAVSLTNLVNNLTENTDTTSAIRIADIVITDDALGTNNLTLSGADAGDFEIVGNELRLKAGTTLDFEIKTTFDVTVEVDDTGVGATPDDTATHTLSITDINEAPTVALTNLVNNLTEDTDTSSAIRIADIVITDDALGTNNLTLSGTDAGDFEIVGNELRLKAGTSLDFETKTSFDVTVEVDDTGVGSTPDDTAAHSLNITDVNEAPAVALTNLVNNLTEDTDTSSAIRVADIVITDDALGTNNLTLSGADAGDFEIVGNELRLKAGTTLDFEIKTTFDVTVEVDDTGVGGTPDDTAAHTLSITDINEAPTVSLTNLVNNLTEDTDTSSAIRIADIVITDDALGTNNLTLSGADAGDFEIVGNELRLKADTTLDFETKTTFDVTVEVDDTGVGGTPDDTAAHTLNVTDINEAPTVSLTNLVNNLTEDTDTTSAIRIADIMITDDALGTNNLTLSGVDAADFEIVGNELRLKAGTSLDFETKTTFDVNVEVDDTGVGSTPDDIAAHSLNVTDVNEAPTVSLTNLVNNLTEDTDTTSAIRIADIVIIDDALGTNNLTLIGADAGDFEIVGNELRLKSGTSLDFEAKTTFDVVVEVDDTAVGATPDDTATHSLNITDVNEAPTVSLTNLVNNLTEDTDTTSAIRIADIVIADDALGTNNLTLIGADAGDFEIVGNELRLKAGTSLDFETKTSFDVTVEVDDTGVGGTPDDTAAHTLSITDVNESPMVSLTNLVNNLTEDTDTSSAIRIADIVIADDALGTNNLTLSGADAGDFEIVGNELRLKAGTTLDFETKTSFDVTVEVDDTSVDSTPDDTSAHTLNITDVNEAPTVALTNLVNNLTEDTDTSSAIRIADIIITDDALGTNNLTLSGADAGDFEIVGNELRLKAGTTFDFETKTSFVVAVEVDDTGVGGTPDDTAAHTLSITDVNEAPTVSLTNLVINLTEDTDTTSAVRIADIVITDDALGTNNLTLSGADAGDFEIVGNELRLKAGTSLDFETKTSFDVMVEVDDTGVGGTPDDTVAHTLSITDINEAPTVSLTNLVNNLTEDTDTTSAIRIADIVITDDALGTNNLTLSGADAGDFEIVGNELRLKAGTSLDFESKTSFDVTVEVDDTAVGATPDDTAAHALSITDVNEAPTVALTNLVNNLTEDTDTTSEIRIADIVITDDALGTNNLVLSGTDAGDFEIVGNELRLKAGTSLDFEAKTSFDVTVEVDDTAIGTNPDDTATHSLSITDANEAPTVALTNLVNNLTEDTDTSSAIRIANIVITDDALGTNNLTLSGTDAGDFEIVGNELRLKAGTSLDFETKTSFDVTVEVDDTGVGSTPDDTAAHSLSITDVNEAPSVALTNLVNNLTEDTDTTSAIRIADIVITDDALGTNNLTLSGADAGDFEIVGNELRLKSGTSLDFEAKTTFDVVVEVDDTAVGATPDDTAAHSLNVTDVNEAPTVSLTNLVNNLTEDTDTSSAIRIADIIITDDALGTNNLTLSGADAGDFEIVGNELRLKAGTTFDFETKTSFVVAVEVDDTGVGGTPDDTAAHTLNVTDVNEAPTVSLTNLVNNLTEDTDTSSAVRIADIVITDDALGTNNLTLSGADAGDFEIVGNELRLKAGTSLDFETKTSFDVMVEVDDTGVGATPDDTAAHTLSITDVNEAPAVSLTNLVNNLTEDTDTTSAIRIADIVITDDALGTNNLTLSGADADDFEIVGNELLLKAGTSLDFETKTTFDVTVEVDDTGVGGTPDDTAAHTLSITDVNEAPTVSLTNLVNNLTEDTDTTSAIRIADIVITDDALGTNNLTLSGADAGDFEIVGNELRLKAGTTLDFEAKTTFDVVVEVDDTAVGATPDDTAAHSLNVTDVNEAPTVSLTNLVNNLTEDTDTTSAIRIADIVITDDALGTNNLTLSGADAGDFEIVGNELRLKAGTSLDFETKTSFDVMVEVDDTGVGGTPDDTAAHTLSITDVNEAPTVSLTNLVNNLTEDTDTTSAIRIADIVITDDALGTNNLTLSGADAGDFEIVGNELRLKAGTTLDFETKTAFDVTVEVDDTGVGSTPDNSAVHTLNITDINEAPTVSLTNLVNDLTEDTDTTSAIRIADIVITDDALGTNNLTLSGADAADFEIVGNELRLKAGTTFDIEVKNSFDVTVEVDDTSVGTTPDDTAAHTLNITDVNQTPSVSLTNLVNGLSEDADTSVAIRIADIVITDDALGTNNLTLSGADAGEFEIVGNELRLKAGASLDFETKTAFGVIVEVDDPGVGSTPDDDAAHSLSITDVNEAPTVSLTNLVNNLNEDADTSSAIRIADIVITDDALGTNDLTLSGADAGDFEIVGNQLQLKAGTSLDFESKTSFDVTVEVDDTSVGSTPDDTATQTLSITDVNEAPTVSLTNLVNNLTEDTDTSSAIRIADIVITDDTLGTNNLTLSGADAAEFEIVGNELRLKAGTTLDFETKSTFDVTVEVDDPDVGATPDDSVVNTLNITDVNEAPTVSLTNLVNSLPEDTDTSSAIRIADIVITDDAMGTNNLTLSGTDAADFEIVGNELRIKAGTTLDFESKTSFDVTVEVDDAGVGGTPDDTAAHAISITDVNEAPLVTLSNLVNLLSEDLDTSSSIRVADIAITDDALGTNNLTLSGADASDFEIIGNELRLKAGTSIDFETKASFDVTVEVDDNTVGGTPDDATAFSLNITDINETPTVSLTNLVNNLTEDTDTSSAVRIADILISDDALGTNSLSLSGADAADFEIVGNELRLKAGTVLDFESKTIFDVTVEIDDTAVGATPDDTVDHSLNIVDVNDAPVITSDGGGSAANISIVENTTVVTKAVASDQDTPGDTLTYSISGGVDATDFVIDATTGDLSFVSAPDFESPTDSNSDNDYEVEILVTDGNGGSDIQSITVSILDGNETPTTSGIPDLTVDEDPLSDPTSYNLHLAFSDFEDSDSLLTYTIVGNTNPSLTDSISISPTDRIVVDFASNQNGVADLTVRATDTGGAFVETTFRITVNPVNDDPFVANPVAPIIVNEDAVDSLIDLSSIFDDVDILTNGDVLSYSVISNSNPALVSSSLVGNDLTLDFQDDQSGSATVVVRATDLAGESVTETIDITVNPINDDPIVADQLFNIDENAANGTTVGFIAASPGPGDAMAGDTIIDYSVTGGTGAGIFAVDGLTGEITVLDDSALDFESNATFTLDIEVTDSGSPGLTDTSTVTINLNDLNEAPLVSSQSFPIAENASNGTIVGTIAASDADAGTQGDLTFAVTGGTGAAAFDVDNDGQITVADSSLLDFESTPSLTLEIEVTDGGGMSSTATITVDLSDLNEAPAISLTNLVNSLTEDSDSSSAIRIADILITDDALGTNNLTLSGADASKFEIVGNELRLKAGTALDFESQASFDVIVEVDDTAVGGTPDGTATHTLNISDVNEAPTVSLTNLINTLAEDTDTSSAIRIADIAVSDDALGTNHLSLSGADAAKFEIVGNELRLKAGVVLDFESQPSFDVTVEVDDTAVGATPDDLASLTLNITDVNEAPTVSLANVVNSLPEGTDTSAAIRVADIVVSDDALGTNGLTLSGADAGNFEIVGVELRLKAGTSLDFETKTSYDVTVVIDDSSVGSTPDDFVGHTLNISDVNDAPIVSLTNVVNTLDEFTDTSSSVRIADILVLDDALGTNNLTLSGTDASDFEIVGNELRLKAGTLLDFETKTSFDVRVEIDDVGVGGTPDDVADHTLNITDVNEAPAMSLINLVNNLTEDSDTTSAIRIADIAISDDALGTNNLTLTGADAANFEIFGTELRLKAGTNLDFETKASFDVTVQLDDSSVGATPDDTADHLLTIIDVNEAASVSLSNLVNNLSENTDTSTAIRMADIIVSDDALGINNLALSGADAGQFEIVGNELRLKAGTNLDFETQASYDVTVEVDDVSIGSTPDDGVTHVLNVTDLNERPSVSLANVVGNINENTDTTASVKIADIVIGDDALGINNLTLSGADADDFEIVGTELHLKSGTVLDFESKANFDVRVEVDDTSVGSTPDDTVDHTLGVINVNEAPTVLLTNLVTDLDENSDTSSSIRVADILVSDDALGTNNLSLSGADASNFEIVGTELRLKAGSVLDFEAKQTLDVRVEIEDNSVGSTPDDSADYSLSLNDLNETPAVSLANVVGNLPENSDTAASIRVADIVISDDALGVNELSLSGSDAAHFEIVGSELRLKAGTTLDFETKSFFDVRVEVDDLSIGLSPDDVVNHTLNITDANDAPQLLNNSLNIMEGQTVVLNSGNLSATDIDNADPALLFHVSNVQGGRFALASDPGNEITSFTQGQVIAGGIVFVDNGDELRPTYDVAIDDGGLTDGPRAANVTFTNVNDAPIGTSDEYTISTGSAFNGFGLLDNDVDYDSASLTTELDSAPSNGTAIVKPDGSFFYIPQPDFSGRDSFTYIINDGLVDSEPITVVVNVAGIGTTQNTEPVATESSEPEPVNRETYSANTGNSDAPQVKVSPNLLSSDVVSIETISRVRDDIVAEPTENAQFNVDLNSTALIFRPVEAAEATKLDELRAEITDNDLINKGSWFWKALDENKTQLQSESQLAELLMSGSAAIASSITVGYLVWLIKGGQVLAAVMANLPAWRMIDPLPILSSISDFDDDDDSLQKIIEEGEDELESVNHAPSP